MKLCDIASYVKDKIKVNNINADEYVTTDNMLPNRRGITKNETLPKANSVTKYLQDDVLISNIRPYFKKIWYANQRGGCSNDVLVFRVKDKNLCSSKFLYYALSQDSFFDHMMAGAI